MRPRLNSALWQFPALRAELSSRRNQKMKCLKIGATLFSIALLALCVGCSSTYYTYSDAGVLRGHGGASKNVDGIDLWVVGTPPRKFRIIGYIEDSRPGGPIPMAARNPQLAALVRQRGGEGLLLNSDTTQVMGSFSTASATATGWGSATTFGGVTNFNGGARA
jgi:hypothetical protein